VRTVTTCGDPEAGSPCSSVSVFTTLTGVSSPHSTGSAASAASITSSNPAAASRSANRSCARATNPVDTGEANRACINIAVRSTATFPAEANRIAAALTFCP
jgi:hypothetical protein